MIEIETDVEALWGTLWIMVYQEEHEKAQITEQILAQIMGWTE